MNADIQRQQIASCKTCPPTCCFKAKL
jgi:hypothetical protein